MVNQDKFHLNLKPTNLKLIGKGVVDMQNSLSKDSTETSSLALELRLEDFLR